MNVSIHAPFALQVVAKHDDLFIDYGPDEQMAHVLEALHRVSNVTPFLPADGTTVVDLAGFGTAPIVYVTAEEEYLLLSDIAQALGWPLHKAHSWAELEYGFAIRDQRDDDEERGDGRLGWERLLDYVDLRLSLIEDTPEAKPDANGRRWSSAGDWLISRMRLPLLLMSSPWAKEFMDNTLPAFGHAVREVWGDKLKAIPTVTADGEPAGGNAYDELFSTGGLSEEEALRRARRGPVAPSEDDREGDGQ